MRWIVCLLALVCASSAFAESTIVVSVPKDLPAMKSFVVVRAGTPCPGADKHDAIVQVSQYKQTLKLPDAGPFDLWWVPASGMPVLTAAKWKPEDGANEINLNALLGLIEFRGDNQPRGSVVVTPQGDPGPGEKGHVIVQRATEYRVDMVVPAGFYALWVVPDNGAKPQRVIDRVRVLPGKRERLD